MALASTASLFENWIVLFARRGAPGVRELDLSSSKAAVEPVPITAEHLAICRDAFVRFGKGRHPARLNFGDCFAYALARASGEPLLFKGDHFSRTDVLGVDPVAQGRQ
jgi:ribonuclease VapC